MSTTLKELTNFIVEVKCKYDLPTEALNDLFAIAQKTAEWSADGVFKILGYPHHE